MGGPSAVSGQIPHWVPCRGLVVGGAAGERERERERERETLLGNREGVGRKYPGAQECRVGGEGV